MNLKNNKLLRNQGLTLVELIVVISIFLIITSVVLFNYSNFNSSVSLQNLTDDIALSIRKAQSFAIGARGVKESNEVVDFTKSYGVHFSVEESTSMTNPLFGSNKSFLMFSTLASVNKSYDSGSGSCGSTTTECIELFEILSNDKIKSIVATGDDSIIKPSSNNASVDIVFTRPDPRAVFCYKSTPVSSCESLSRVDVVISNNQTDGTEKIKTISVQNTGQISIQ